MATRAPRMATADRRSHILESAKALILESGLSALSLDEVAKTAGISKSLMYRHFSSREDLISALLNQEYRALRGNGVRDVPGDVSFAALANGANFRTFDYYLNQGPIVRILLADPGVAQMLGARDRNERASVNKFFAAHVEKTYHLPPQLASLGAFLMLNAATNSGGALKRFDVDAREATDFWTTFVLAGFAAVSARYGARLAPKSKVTPLRRRK